MNVNDGTVLAIGLVGYLPYLETAEKNGTAKYKAAKHYLLLVCGHYLVRVR